MMQAIDVISREDDPGPITATMAQVERFGLDALPGVNVIDPLHSESAEGYTTLRLGTLTKHVHGLVTIVTRRIVDCAPMRSRPCPVE